MPKGSAFSTAALRRAWCEQKMTMDEMATRFGISRRMIQYHAKNQGWPKRKPVNRLARLTPEAVKPMWDFGLTSEDIASLLGVTHHAVNAFAYRRGWKRGKGWHSAGKRTLSEWREYQLQIGLKAAAQREQAVARRKFGRAV